MNYNTWTVDDTEDRGLVDKRRQQLVEQRKQLIEQRQQLVERQQ